MYMQFTCPGGIFTFYGLYPAHSFSTYTSLYEVNILYHATFSLLLLHRDIEGRASSLLPLIDAIFSCMYAYVC